MIKTNLKKQSVREKLFLDISNRLEQLVDSSSSKVIKCIDLWNNQWTYITQEKPFNFPCVFIEFVSIPWKSIGAHAQQGEVTINLHIGSETTALSRQGSPSQSKALEHLRILDAVHLLLTGWGAEHGYGSFTRINSQHDHDHNEIIAHVETYKFTIKDLSAVTDWIKLDGDKFVIERP